MLPIESVGSESQSLDSFLSNAMGDMPATPSGPSSAEAADGAPPVSPPNPAPDGPAPTREPGEPSGDPTAAPSAQPDDADVLQDIPQDAAPDSLANAKPLTYKVDGQERTFEGIKVLGEDGAIIEPQFLADVQQRLSERDHLYETNQRQYQTLSEIERLSTWPTTGTDGQQTTVNGAEALVEMRCDIARKDARIAVLEDALTDPEKLTALFGGVGENGMVIPNRQVLQAILDRVEASELKRDMYVRRIVGQVRADHAKPVTPPADYTSMVPQIFENVARDAGIDLSGLPEQDKTFFHRLLASGEYFRPATPEEVQRTPSLRGQQVVRPSFADLVKDRVSVRREQHQQVKDTATSTSTAAAQNAKRLAAANRGRPTPAAPSPKPTQPMTRQQRAEAASEFEEAIMRRTSRPVPA